MFNLRDYRDIELNTDDIVKHENQQTGEVKYYLIGEKMMYLYDDLGMFQHDSFKNSPIDWSVTLVNDERSRWTRMGSVAEVYDEIFG